MSFRFYIEGVQLFGNNELPDVVLKELERQGLEGHSDSFSFYANDPDGLLSAIEKATLERINGFAKEDDDLIKLSNKLYENKRVILDEINKDSEMKSHLLYWNAKNVIDEKVFFIPMNFVQAVSGKCEFVGNKLFFKKELKGRKGIAVQWY